MHFKNISELMEYMGAPAPENPLLALVQFNRTCPVLKNKEVAHDFYTICFKKIESGQFLYGKTKYDGNTGFMYFFRPGQKLTIHDVVIKDNGFSIYVHEDYLINHPLFAEIRKYNFFDYEINEALHLSPKEREIMWSLYQKMEDEYKNNPDEFSRSIILSHLDSMLKYAQRFYKRQFIDRKPLSGAMVTKFNDCLDSFFTGTANPEKRLPSVGYVAEQLHISSKYLSDLLKQETGKSALELIHMYVISEAKNMLVEGNSSIAEIAYRLGFENPPYFSRLFKKEVGISPKEFKNHFLN
ncbi:MAG: helix-turn-helix transcriptional regulator [Ignavibacteria bacterium]|nr:helix-turn-helix transcriptional regulator [Ignavibacteria bacterium]